MTSAKMRSLKIGTKRKGHPGLALTLTLLFIVQLLIVPGLISSTVSTVRTFSDSSQVRSITFQTNGTNNATQILIPHDASIISAGLNVSGAPVPAKGAIIHTTDADFNQAQQKTNLTVQNGNVSLSATPGYDWSQSDQATFLGNEFHGLIATGPGVELGTNPGVDNTKPFPLDDNTTGLWHCNENAGTTLVDSSINKNNGTLMSGAGWSSGRFSSGVSFNGGANFVSIPHNVAYNLHNISVEAWMITPTNGYDMFFVTRRSNAQVSWELGVDYQNHPFVGIQTSTTFVEIYLKGKMNIEDGKWHLVGFNYDEVTLNLILDGHIEATMGLHGPISNYNIPILLGKTDNGGWSYPFDGNLDEVRISNSIRRYSPYQELQGNMTSPPISAQGPTFGNLHLNITVPEHAGYFIDVLDSKNVTRQGHLHNGDPITVDPKTNPQIRLRLTMYANYNTTSPILHSWGVGTRLEDFFGDISTYGTRTNTTSYGGVLALAASPVTFSKDAGNPQVTQTAWTSATVIKDGNLFKMWYVDTTGGIPNAIKYGTSPDGVNWNFYSSAVLSLGTSGQWDSVMIERPCVLKIGNEYKMWYSGYKTTWVIGYANSTDGINWNKAALNPIFANESAGTWDSSSVSSPSVIYDGHLYYMWYSGFNNNLFRIGLATSIDGKGFQRDFNNPVMSIGGMGAWDDTHVFHPRVIKDEGIFKMWYTGMGQGVMQIGYATSKDGKTWTKAAENPVMKPGAMGDWDGHDLCCGATLKVGNEYDMWYSGSNSPSEGIGLARSVISGSGSMISRPFTLQYAPTRIDKVTWTANLPSGTTVKAYVRTSFSVNQWNPWEQVDQLDATIASTPGTLLQWRFDLDTSTPGVRPTVSHMRVDFNYSKNNGTLLSLPITTQGVTSTLKPTLNITLPSGTKLNLSLTNDGTTWKYATSGVSVTFATKGNQVMYKMIFSGDGLVSPILHDIKLDYQYDLYPNNPSVDIGGNGIKEWQYKGNFSSYEMVPNQSMVSAIKDYLNLHQNQTDQNGNISIPIVVTVNGPGTISLSNLTIFYSLPPSFQFSPTGTDIPLNSTIWINSSVPVHNGSWGQFSITPVVLGTLVQSEAGRLHFIPTSPLKENKTYIITLKAGTVTVDGYKVTKDLSWNFTTVVLFPKVLWSRPVGPHQDLNATLTIMFSKAMDLSSIGKTSNVDASNLSGHKIVPLDQFGALSSVDGQNISVTPLKPLSYDTTYVVIVSASATDTYGNQIGTDYSWSFITVSKPIIIPTTPKVLGYTPTGTNENLTATITITFSEAMDKTTAQNAFSMNPAVMGSFSWFGNTMIFKPSVNLTCHTDYTVAVSSNAKNLAGRSLSAKTQWVFTTTACGVVPPPKPHPATTNWWPFAIMAVIIAGMIAAVAAVASRRKKKVPAQQPAPAQTQPQYYAQPAPVQQAQVETTTAAAPVGQAQVPSVPIAPVQEFEDFRITDIFIIYKDGRLVSHASILDETSIDKDIMSSMLIAIRSFVQDSFQAKDGALDSFEFSGRKVILVSGDHLVLVTVLNGAEPSVLRDEMSSMVQKLEGLYAGIIENWDGNQEYFKDAKAQIAPLFRLRSRLKIKKREEGATVRSAIEFYQGYVRLKVAVLNNNISEVITDCRFKLFWDKKVLTLSKIVPQYDLIEDVAMLENLRPGEKKTVAYYLDPLICMVSFIDGTLTYHDSTGVHAVNMKTRPADIVCPIFYTKETINVAMLKRLLSEMSYKDSKIFMVQGGVPIMSAYEKANEVVKGYDIKAVREFKEEEPFSAETWYYGEVKEGSEKIIVRTAARMPENYIEFFVATNNLASLTGLLAELGGELSKKMETSGEQRKSLAPVTDEKIKEILERTRLLLEKFAEKDDLIPKTDK